MKERMGKQHGNIWADFLKVVLKQFKRFSLGSGVLIKDFGVISNRSFHFMVSESPHSYASRVYYC